MPSMIASRPRVAARIAVPPAIARLLSLLCLALGAGSSSATRVLAGDESEQGTACAIPAFFQDDDATLVAAYDGLRRGLEEAHLPRVCRRRPDGADAAAWDRVARDVSSKGVPFLVVFGRALAAKVAAAPFVKSDGSGRIPCVYVDAVSTASGVAYPEWADPAPPAAVVLAESPIEATAAVIRRLLPGRSRPKVRLAWETDVPATRDWRHAVELAGVSLRFATGPPDDSDDAILDAPVSLGERPQAFETALARAREAHLPLVSLDRGRFGKGASVVICPDGALLGRMAAEAARRLRDGEGADKAIRLSVRSVEVLVDLGAADAQGVHIPLACLASADRIRTSKAPPSPNRETAPGSGR